MNADLSCEARARIHAALGDPARLAITDALAAGDVSPEEIAARMGLPTNLIAHHLKVLEDARVITRARSEADRRRTYVRLCPQVLAALRLASLAIPRRVVFVCTANSARSQLAAALWSVTSPVLAASAGTHPAPYVHPTAVRTAKRHGLRLHPTRTSHVDDVRCDGDLVIAVCDHAHESLPVALARLHWSVPDPAESGTDAAFESAYVDLAERISRLTPVLTCG